MAYLAVNKDGTEKRFDHSKKPYKDGNRWVQWAGPIIWIDEGVTVPFGTIIALTGQKITFEDEPIKI